MEGRRADAVHAAAAGSDLAGQAEEFTSRLAGGMSRLAAQAHRGARRVKHAAKDLRTSPVLQHAIAARERGNFEAAFWLLSEEFTRHPEAPDVALHYWDVALTLGRVDLASAAGVKLIESRVAAGENELAAQHWIELVKEAPNALVSPAAIAKILPALKERLAETSDDGPVDRQTLAGYLRRAVRQAVDPRNTGLHPGVALRIFEEGREINPEAARRAAEAALESEHLHDAKRERLLEWLGGESEGPPARAATPARPTPPKLAAPVKAAEPQPSRPPVAVVPEPTPEPRAQDAEVGPASDASEAEPEPEEGTGPRLSHGSLVALEDDALVLCGDASGRLPYADIQAVSVAEIMGIEDSAVMVVDLILNWARRQDERLEITRLRVEELDFERLVSRKHALGSDFAALMGDIMERTSAVPLPDPESALGTRITCFASPDLYENIALRAAAREPHLRATA